MSHNSIGLLNVQERSTHWCSAPVRAAATPKSIVKFISMAHAISAKHFRNQNSSSRAAPAFTPNAMAHGSRKKARQNQCARRAEYCLKQKGWCSPAAASSRGSPESMDRDGLL